MVVYDFEVFKDNWMGVFADLNTKQEHVIIDDAEELRRFYDDHVNDIWVGFNNKHYDQYILKGILLGMNPKEINDAIIVDGKEGWQLSRSFNEIKLINYDVMPNPPIGLKTLEGFLGVDIRESDVDFRVERALTDEEIAETVKYCEHDVKQTLNVMLHRIDDFNTMKDLLTEFKLPISHIGDSDARITARILGCKKHDYNDEFDYEFFPQLQIEKYKDVIEWYRNAKETCIKEMMKNHALAKPWDKHKYDWKDEKAFHKYFYGMGYERMVAGVPHIFGFGGLHGASKSIYRKGLILHVDVNNYYPSMLIAHNIVTRSATNDNYKLVYNKRKELKRKQLEATDKNEKKMWKKKQLPYKLMLNALSGAMKDKTNPAYDPRNNNIMCINGQLMLLDLIEHLEVVDGFELIQSNTDGLIIMIPDSDNAFNQVDDICYEWEQRFSTSECDIKLELDVITEIYQKDVNNYLWLENGECGERKGAYVKELSPLDYDLPIVNEAMVNYMVHKIPVENTIMECDDFIKFQKIVKLSDKFEWVEHNGKQYKYKCYRVYASNRKSDGKLYKCKKLDYFIKRDKFAITSDHCFLHNESVIGLKCPPELDKQWYVDLAKERLRQFGVVI